MGSHRDNAQFGRANWKRRILLPCWIVQLSIALGLMGLFSYRLSRTMNKWQDSANKGEIPEIFFVWESVNIGFSALSLVVTLAQIARFIAEVLTPLPLLFGSILSITLSAAILVLDIFVYVQHKDKKYSMIGLGLDLLLVLVTTIPLIYSVIIYRRLLTYDEYHLPGNVKPFGYASAEDGLAEDTAYRSSSGSVNALTTSTSTPTPYDPTADHLPPATSSSSSNGHRRTDSLGVPGVGSSNNRTRERSLSAGSRHSVSPMPSPGLSASPMSCSPSPPSLLLDTASANTAVTAPSTTAEKRGSYDHRRDPQFDSFVAARQRERSLSGSGSRAHSRSGSVASASAAHARSRSGGSDTLPKPYHLPPDGLGSLGGFNALANLSTGTVTAGHPMPPPLLASQVGRQTSFEASVVSPSSTYSASIYSQNTTVTPSASTRTAPTRANSSSGGGGAAANPSISITTHGDDDDEEPEVPTRSNSGSTVLGHALGSVPEEEMYESASEGEDDEDRTGRRGSGKGAGKALLAGREEEDGFEEVELRRSESRKRRRANSDE
ncbi:hypothetical protein F4780DRAFT_798234 [Xylariomycetidae sp. FL0641]|nr:hypothetical protein F4780DRAFT_798234 [Xylariomycetidae sp. FL0641]